MVTGRVVSERLSAELPGKLGRRHDLKCSKPRARYETQYTVPDRIRLSQMSAFHVRRDKAALIQRVQAPPGDRSSRKQLGQAWR
jgi:hypothetical protein